MLQPCNWTTAEPEVALTLLGFLLELEPALVDPDHPLVAVLIRDAVAADLDGRFLAHGADPMDFCDAGAATLLEDFAARHDLVRPELSDVVFHGTNLVALRQMQHHGLHSAHRAPTHQEIQDALRAAGLIVRNQGTDRIDSFTRSALVPGRVDFELKPMVAWSYALNSPEWFESIELRGSGAYQTSDAFGRYHSMFREVERVAVVAMRTYAACGPSLRGELAGAGWDVLFDQPWSLEVPRVGPQRARRSPNAPARPTGLVDLETGRAERR